jgi:hypothetical protein
MFRCRINANRSFVKTPVLKFPFRLPVGAPPPAPCMRHTLWPLTAGARQRLPERFERAVQRGALLSRAVSNLTFFVGCIGLIAARQSERGLFAQCFQQKNIRVFLSKKLF